ncbi:MAG: hypothetical protein ABIP48_31405 [Planctomycetota bacterium]
MTELLARQAGCTFVVLVLIGVGASCRQSTSADRSRREVAEAFGKLPGLSETPHPKLQAELAHIIEEGGTPELLARSEISEEENVALGLADLFEPSEIQKVLDASSRIFGSGNFEFDPARLEKAIRFRQEHEAKRLRAREALRRPKCRFPVDYQAGFTADLSWIDVVRICARLEAVRAFESLAGGDVDAAVESLEAMFRLAACLAAEKLTTARLEGAFVRAEALAVLRGIVEYPEISRPIITRGQLGRLSAIVQEQLKTWTPDQDAWIGDRALGMHVYELVRAGRLADLLTDEEMLRFADEGILGDLPAAAQRNVNEDELYYLETMREVIDGCSRPYHERIKTFKSIRQALHEKRNSPEFPLVAGRILLLEFETGHAIQAEDRANCEAWALALALASGNQQPPYQVSPFSGVEYEVARRDGRVIVRGASPKEYAGMPPVAVPDLAGRKPEE